jgi:hypothetical protein
VYCEFLARKRRPPLPLPPVTLGLRECSSWLLATQRIAKALKMTSISCVYVYCVCVCVCVVCCVCVYVLCVCMCVCVCAHRTVVVRVSVSVHVVQ